MIRALLTTSMEASDRSVIAYPAILHFSESHHYIREVSPANTMAYDSIGGSNMVNLRSGEQLWQPLASDWDVLEWDIEYTPNPKGTWYRVPGSRRCVHLDYITSWIHWPTKYTWYLVEDMARPLCACPSLPHQIKLILTKFTLRRMIITKRGGDAMPVASGRSLSPTLPHPMSSVGAILMSVL